MVGVLCRGRIFLSRMRYMEFSRYFFQVQGLKVSDIAECCPVSYSWDRVRAMGDLPEVPSIR